MKMQMTLDEQSSTTMVVTLKGEFDAQGCKEIRDELESTAGHSKGKTLVLDIYDVSFMDSSGIGAIIFLFKRARANDGSLRLIRAHGQPKELLSLLRVNEAIPIEWASEQNLPYKNAQ